MPLHQTIAELVNPMRAFLSSARHSAQRITPSRPHVAHDGVQDDAKPAKRVTQRPVSKAKPKAETPALSIPCPDPTAEERACDLHQSHGQRLARQENWLEISKAVRAAEALGTRTQGGMPVANLIAFGARSDVVFAAEHALVNGFPPKDAPLMDGIVALEEVLAEFPDDHAIAAIVAHAHIDMAWAWRGTGWAVDVPARNLEAFDAHFDRARDIITPFQGKSTNSPLLAAINCAILSATKSATQDVVRAYEALIALDPLNARTLRNMGLHLLPKCSGVLHEVELQARRMASQTHATWGAGAYTWVMLDVIATSDTSCAALDVEFFIEGIHDILSRRADQATVNLMAAYCANTMGMTIDASNEAAFVRAQISDCAKWIVREHLTELHPMTWAHAARGFDNNLRVRCPDRFAAAGLADAHRILTDLFRRELAAGKRVVFTARGAELQPA